MKTARIAFVLFAMTVASVATAQVRRTFVSAQLGNDANNCLPATPCRNFARAITAVDAGGEVVVLDSGGYGPFTVNKAVTVQVPTGVYAGCTALSGNAITVNAGPSDTIVLRGLTLNGAGSGAVGVDFQTGAVLHVENAIINGFTLFGITDAHASQLFVNDSIIRNGNNAGMTVLTATASVSRVRFENINGFALWSDNGANVVATESVATGSLAGFYTSSPGTMTLENCISSGNSSGVVSSGASALVRVSNSTITNNGTGVSTNTGGSLLSRTNNLVEGNGTDGTFTGTFSAK